MLKKTKKMTLENVATKVDTLSARMSARMNSLATTLENLAIMTAKGFENVDSSISELKSDVSGLKSDVSQLQQGQEKVLMRLDNVAYRFEVKDLEKRVDRLETKAGFSS